MTSHWEKEKHVFPFVLRWLKTCPWLLFYQTTSVHFFKKKKKQRTNDSLAKSVLRFEREKKKNSLVALFTHSSLALFIQMRFHVRARGPEESSSEAQDVLLIKGFTARAKTLVLVGSPQPHPLPPSLLSLWGYRVTNPSVGYMNPPWSELEQV